ncbi:cupin domain-containing protein [Ferruginibacter sp. SUN002]|uniref:cupin domain-containing protein n=1 Tax=Ferruginibacter sp. SUN002 TaxID=2937789 RepID=UPI003D36FD62
MKKLAPAIMFCGLTLLLISSVIGKQNQQSGYTLEHEKDIVVTEAGPHSGGGSTKAYKFFKKEQNSKLQFTKRILRPGAAIGYHLQKEEEIYYIISGKGEMMMNGETFNVEEGDAILTHAGSSHGLKQTGSKELVMIINYEKK